MSHSPRPLPYCRCSATVRSGSAAAIHVRMVNAAGNEITLINHGSRSIHPTTMGRIVESAGINPDHFLWGLGRADRRGRRAPRGWRPEQSA